MLISSFSQPQEYLRYVLMHISRGDGGVEGKIKVDLDCDMKVDVEI